MNAQLRASGMGIPFMPIHTRIFYTDMVRLHPEEWKLVDDPFNPGEKITLVAAVKPDVFLVHAAKADPAGNYMIEHQTFNETLYMKAADRVIVSVEEIVSTAEITGAGGFTFATRMPPAYPYFKTSHVILFPYGAHPTHCYPRYTFDARHFEEYQRYSSTSEEEFGKYLDKYVYSCKSHEEYLEKIGGERKLSLLRNWRRPYLEFQRDQLMERREEKVTDYTIDELMVVLLARHIKDKMVVSHGGDSYIPMAAMRLSKLTHAPNMVYLGGVAGGVNSQPLYLPEMANDIAYAYDMESSIEFENFLDLHARGEFDLGFLSGAQIDKYGNINATLLGNLGNIEVKLPGGGGSGGMYGGIRHLLLWTAAHEKRIDSSGKLYFTLVDKVDWKTAHGNPPPGEQYAGEIGPEVCVTNLCVFDFDEETGIMRLAALYPDTTVETVLENTGFKPIIPAYVPKVEPPTEEEVDILRRVADPTGVRKKEFRSDQLHRRFKF